MADTFLLKPVDLTTTDATTIYTCPTTDDSTVPPTAVFSVFKDKDVGAKGTVELLTNPLILNEGDIVKATAGTANRLHVLLSVMEIT